MHKQKKIFIEVDEKIQPIIQFIFDRLPGIIPIASCQGGSSELNESVDSYILLIVTNVEHLNKLIVICGGWQCQYIPPNIENCMVPMYRVKLINIDNILLKINKILSEKIEIVEKIK